MDFVIGVVMQLIVHVARRVDMNARRDQRDHAEHGDRERIDIVTDRQFHRAEIGQRVPVTRDWRDGFAVASMVSVGIMAAVSFLAMALFVRDQNDSVIE